MRALAWSWLLAAATCSSRTQPENRVSSDMSSTSWTCGSAVAALRARDFTGWRGLAGNCTQELLAAFPAAYDGEGQLQLGSEAVRVAVLRRKAAGYSHTLDVQTGAAGVVRVDIEYPELAGPVPALLAALGPPAASLDYHAGPVPVPGGQRVWPDRGVALYLDAAGTRVNRIALFAQTDLARYRRELEPDLRIYEE